LKRLQTRVLLRKLDRITENNQHEKGKFNMAEKKTKKKKQELTNEQKQFVKELKLIHDLKDVGEQVITCGTRGKGNTTDLKVNESIVAAVGYAAKAHGYIVKPHHSQLQSLSLINPANGRILATFWVNSKKGTGARLFYNAMGTKLENQQPHFKMLAETIGFKTAELNDEEIGSIFQCSHTGAAEVFKERWRVSQVVKTLKYLKPLTEKTSNRQAAQI